MGAAAFLPRSQTKNMSARSLVQDSGAPAWLSTAGARFPTLAADLGAARASRAVPITRSARCDVRSVAAVFVGADGTVKRCSVISSCRSAARTSRIRLLRRRSQRKNASARSVFHCSLRSLRLALVSRCLPHSLRRRRTCLLARSSRTAARQPGSVRAARDSVFDGSLRSLRSRLAVA